MNIHPSAIVSPEAQLGDNVTVDAFASIESGVIIGAGCVIRERAHICSGSTLGQNCRIHMNAVVGHAPQDFSYKGGPIKTLLGDGVTVRENATIHGSANADGTRVGDNCYLMVGSHVAHDCKLGKGVLLANGALLAGHVQIDDGAFVSGNVVIHQFVRVGRLAMLSGGSRFGMDVPPYLIGDGANSVTLLNSVGLRRSTTLNEQDRREIKAAYKILYRSGLPLPRALERLAAEFTSAAVKHWLEFFSTPSKRGFCRYWTAGRRSEMGE
ncbi:MAG: acyl-ACP--UDP-N-acetylglucosamine O-acyltransferase [Planctomycetota bacterium]